MICLPEELYCLKPHAYQSLGAPYGDLASPWMLRQDVIRRLLIAQGYLQKIEPQFCLALFDCWRPIRVQKFMYEYAINQECISRGIDRFESAGSSELKDVIESVATFWALPSLDKSMPPPHSTGGAVDLTIATKDGVSLEMGGQIDCMGPISRPDYYFEAAHSNRDSSAHLWHSRRMILLDVMKRSGFVQHPHEWWHFSYGDQLWAWSNNSQAGFYGAVDESDSKSIIN
ncbi:D-ala-D-ala dipeptidase [Prochlorococcus marinus str. LG]|nr:D-ala-D-ala dipeptidase [Prochlorococcus marinus str. LG]